MGNEINEKEIAVKVSRNTVIGNILLTAGKIAVGILSGSSALISDGIHSLSDVFSTVIVVIGISVSRKEADKEHLYGHERFECIASVILSVMLFMTGITIGKTAFFDIINGYEKSLDMGYIAAFTAFLSIASKEYMYRYTKSAAVKINSTALMADAHHHRSDALSSIGSFIGIIGSKMGYPISDGIASIIICFFIIKTSYEIFKESVDRIVDKSCDETTIQKMKNIVNSVEGVITIDEIKTRLFGSKIYVDIEISANSELNLKQAHSIAENVHSKIEANFPNVKHCMVHVNPFLGKD